MMRPRSWCVKVHLMATETQNLPNDVEELKQLLVDARRELEAEQAETKRLRERLQLYLQKRFGPSSEKWDRDQFQIFNEAEDLADPTLDEAEEPESESEDAAAPEAEGKAAPKPRRPRGRRPLPEWLPRRDVIHDLSPEEKICPHDGEELKRIGEVVSEQLEYVPAKIQVIRNVRIQYACPGCEECVRLAPLPAQPIPKSMASVGLLVQIAVSKYCDSLPLYRQARIFERIGIDLSRTTMANWMIRVGELVQPVINLLRDEMLATDHLQCDETRCQVLKEAGRAAETQSYFWAQRTGSYEQPIVLFDYDPSRGSQVPKRLLEGFEGYLQVDGYSGYDAVIAENPGIIRVGCMAHARRKFDEALKAQTGGKKSAKEKRGKTKAHQGLAFTQKLYRIEKRVRGESPEVRKAAREAEAVPILVEMKAWLDAAKEQVPPRSLTGQAIAYALGQWDSLCRYVEDGRLEIDNNRIENTIRPFVLGRKNWLFSDTVRGAEASANLYSLIETAKANGLELYPYLCHLLTELPKATTVDEIEALLPTRWRPAVLSPRGIGM